MVCEMYLDEIVKNLKLKIWQTLRDEPNIMKNIGYKENINH